MKEFQELVLSATNKKQKKGQAVQAATVKSNKSLNITQQKELKAIRRKQRVSGDQLMSRKEYMVKFCDTTAALGHTCMYTAQNPSVVPMIYHMKKLKNK